MKQGTANSRVGSTKVEPKAHAVSVAAVSDIGQQEIRFKSKPLYKGRGYEAPKAKGCQHKAGSQGRY